MGISREWWSSREEIDGQFIKHESRPRRIKFARGKCAATFSRECEVRAMQLIVLIYARRACRLVGYQTSEEQAEGNAMLNYITSWPRSNHTFVALIPSVRSSLHGFPLYAVLVRVAKGDHPWNRLGGFCLSSYRESFILSTNAFNRTLSTKEFNVNGIPLCVIYKRKKAVASSRTDIFTLLKRSWIGVSGEVDKVTSNQKTVHSNIGWPVSYYFICYYVGYLV